MSTPDTEEEWIDDIAQSFYEPEHIREDDPENERVKCWCETKTEIREGQIHIIHREIRNDVKGLLLKLHSKLQVEHQKAISSRDTYWKERVRKAQAITYMRGYRSGYSDGDGQRRYDDIPDESELDTLLDNLN